MLEIVVLRAGYSRPDDDVSSLAGCSISLVRGGNCGPMLVDTGGPSERELLLLALANNQVTPEEIVSVVCTHGHIDHIGNANLFPHATFFSGRDRAVGDRFWSLQLAAGPVTIADGIQLMASPGHTSEDISVLVETPGGVVAIAGDVFEHGDPMDSSWRAYSRDPRMQRRSQAALLRLAHRIVPGHGSTFSVAEYTARAQSKTASRSSGAASPRTSGSNSRL